MPNLTFTVDSALLRELGEKLVETVHIALVELVKNSYDADATKVIVKFRQGSTGGPEIQIIDNGIGMTLEDVRKYWMRIATTNKIENKLSLLYGRPKTGSKGIGRFACRRLGSSLQLITIGKTEKGLYEKTEVIFPWNEFIAGTDVTEIHCSGESKIISEDKTGTTLIISNSLTNEWKKMGYEYLKRQLGVLVANRGTRRPGFKEDPGFNIVLDIPEFKGGSVKDLRKDFINGGWGTLTAYIDEKGHPVCTLDALEIGTKTIKSQEIFPNLCGVNLKIGIIPISKKQIRNPKLLSKEILKKILPDWGGVQVRFNGFRVYPYGDDDWLDIDKDRGVSKGKPESKQLFIFAESLKGVIPSRVLLSLLSMRNYMGVVNIDSRTTGLEMKANREGFIRSEAADEIKSFTRYAIDWATIYRDYYIRLKTKQDSEVAREHLAAVLGRDIEPEKVVESAVLYIKDQVKNISTFLPLSEKHKIEKSFLTATDAILKRDQFNKQELHHLRLISSTSTLLLIFSHEVKSLLGSIEADKSSLQTIEKKLVGKDAKLIREVWEGLDNSKYRLADLLKMTSLISVDSKKAIPQRLALVDRLKNAEKCFKLIIDDYNINIDYSKVPNNLLVGPILEAELYAIILNVLSNSVKSVIAAGRNKKIEFKASRVNGKNLILMSDTGMGVGKKHYEDVFIPFIADPDGTLYKKLKQHLNPEDEYIVGTGSGLGLSIVKEIIQLRKGSIRFCEPTGIWKAVLEVILP